MLHLPGDVLDRVLQFGGPREAARVASTCKSLVASTTESPVLWQTFVRRDFGMWAEPARSIINVETGLMDWWKSQYRSLLGRHGDIASNNRRVESRRIESEWRTAVIQIRASNIALGAVDPESLAVLTERDPAALQRLGRWAELVMGTALLLLTLTTASMWWPGLVLFVPWVGRVLVREGPLLALPVVIACCRRPLLRATLMLVMVALPFVMLILGLNSVLFGMAVCVVRGTATLWLLPVLGALGALVFLGNIWCYSSRRGSRDRAKKGFVALVGALCSWPLCRMLVLTPNWRLALVVLWVFNVGSTVVALFTVVMRALSQVQGAGRWFLTARESLVLAAAFGISEGILYLTSGGGLITFRPSATVLGGVVHVLRYVLIPGLCGVLLSSRRQQWVYTMRLMAYLAVVSLVMTMGSRLDLHPDGVFKFLTDGALQTPLTLAPLGTKA